MKKTCVVLMVMAGISFLGAKTAKKTVSTYKDYRFSFLSLKSFDYSQRYEGRIILSTEQGNPCLKGTISFLTPLEETPVAIKKTCVIEEAVSDKNISMIFDEEGLDDAPVDHTSNIGTMVFYLRPFQKKETMLSSIKGTAKFKLITKKNYEQISLIHQCPWFPIPQGEAGVLMLNENQNYTVYVILRYNSRNNQNPNLLKLYLYDTETDEKNILWLYTQYSDTEGTQFIVYRVSLYFDKKENVQLIVNDAAYEIPKTIGPASLKNTAINAVLLATSKGNKYAQYVYLLTIPDTRPNKDNWVYLNLDNKRVYYAIKKNKHSAEKKPLLIEECINIPIKYTVNHIGIFQEDKAIFKSIPFQFENIPFEEK